MNKQSSANVVNIFVTADHLHCGFIKPSANVTQPKAITLMAAVFNPGFCGALSLACRTMQTSTYSGGTDEPLLI